MNLLPGLDAAPNLHPMLVFRFGVGVHNTHEHSTHEH